MLKNMFQLFMLHNDNLDQTSCVDTPSHNGVVERKNRHLLETIWALLFQMHVPNHFWAAVVSTACLLINRMPSSVLNWDTLYHILFPNKPLFPIEPWIFRCTCFVRDVRPHVLSVSSLVILELRRAIDVIALVFVGIWFWLMSHFLRMLYSCLSHSLSRTCSCPYLGKTSYHLGLHSAPTPPISIPPPVASTSDPILSNDLSIVLRKGKRQYAHPISSFCSYDYLSSHSCSFIASLDSISLPNKVSEALVHLGWRSAMIEEMDAWTDNGT